MAKLLAPRSPLKIDCQSAGEQGRSRTRQEHRRTTDINQMVKKHRDLNAMEAIKLYEVTDRVLQAGDFDMDKDYGSVVRKKAKLEAAWLKIPAEIRKHHNNNPQDFINFVSNSENKEEAIKRGYIKQKRMIKYYDKKGGNLLYEIPSGLNAEQKKAAIEAYEAKHGKAVYPEEPAPK